MIIRELKFPFYLVMLGVIIAIGLLIALVSVPISSYGRTKYHFFDNDLKDAATYWQQAYYLQSASLYTQTYLRSTEAGVRWIIAEPFMRISSSHFDNGNYQAALNECMHAARIISPYDPEGVVGYDCFVIQTMMWLEENCVRLEEGWDCIP